MWPAGTFVLAFTGSQSFLPCSQVFNMLINSYLDYLPYFLAPGLIPSRAETQVREDPLAEASPPCSPEPAVASCFEAGSQAGLEL